MNITFKNKNTNSYEEYILGTKDKIIELNNYTLSDFHILANIKEKENKDLLNLFCTLHKDANEYVKHSDNPSAVICEMIIRMPVLVKCNYLFKLDNKSIKRLKYLSKSQNWKNNKFYSKFNFIIDYIEERYQSLIISHYKSLE